ncbi:MAG: sigma-54 dependent transcriptional regulator [Gemmatimonadetes bacterium]|nr:sigma-54 dependent transcriptional regulator [Gemmatimonadota bacterium]
MARVFVDGRNLETAIGVREAVQADGHEVELVESARDIEGRLGRAEETALVLTGSPDEPVATAMRGLFETEIPRPPILGVAADDDVEGRRRLADAFDLDDVLALPLDADEVRVVLEAQLDRFQLQRETGIVGRTDPVREILERVNMIAPVASTVLLTGESGTGKELIARAIHRLSPRRGKPFIPVNCAALPESLLESELFGHEKGAFTGATSLRRGMFELADGGTLLLDEIAEMPLPTQTRLLRILESRRFMRVGGDREIEVNVRVVAATNRDLRQAVEVGDFRRDLYYRLNVLNIELPPLRARRDDIPVLVRRFVAEFSRAHDREFRGLAPEALEILLGYDWPGNVRELRNLVESMVVLAPGSVIRPEDIPSEIRSSRGTSIVSSTELASVGPRALETATGGLTDLAGAPQLEFVFRTLIALKVDVEDLKREFEAYKTRARQLSPAAEPFDDDWPGTTIEVEDGSATVIEPAGDRPSWPTPGDGLGSAAPDDGSSADGAPDPGDDGGPTIRFRPGMTMAELEREAIVATLRDVGGNRRKAAEQLQIGERTLYRKIKQYEIDL